MKIDNNTVAEFDYRLREAGGEAIEDTADSHPMAYLHGHGNILPALEKALEGKAAGDHLSVTVSPEEGFGYRDENRIQRVPIKHLHYQGKLVPGRVVTVNSSEGPRQIVVLKVGRFNVDADFNHPFAGMTLEFEIDVVAVREATAEELEHGHAHAPGGHHHS